MSSCPAMTPNWLDLPIDLIEKILACLDVFDVMNFSSTCKTWEAARKKLELDALKSGSTYVLYEPMFLYVHHFSILSSTSHVGFILLNNSFRPLHRSCIKQTKYNNLVIFLISSTRYPSENSANILGNVVFCFV
jgi:hypothetical protein